MKKIIKIFIVLSFFAVITIVALCQNSNKKTNCEEFEKHQKLIDDSNPIVCDKPVIYLYPTKTTNVSVKLDYNGKLTCTYPKYYDEWNVTANPNGTLLDANGKQYNYLFWEGIQKNNYKLTDGYCIKGSDTINFLEEKLKELGLNESESDDFITYWLPKMEHNKYNIIAFQTTAYTENAKLNVNPTPDTTIRVFMTFQSSDKFVRIKEPKINTPKRNGFTLVEWGGAEIIK